MFVVLFSDGFGYLKRLDVARPIAIFAGTIGARRTLAVKGDGLAAATIATPYLKLNYCCHDFLPVDC